MCGEIMQEIWNIFVKYEHKKSKLLNYPRIRSPALFVRGSHKYVSSISPKSRATEPLTRVERVFAWGTVAVLGLDLLLELPVVLGLGIPSRDLPLKQKLFFFTSKNFFKWIVPRDCHLLEVFGLDMSFFNKTSYIIFYYI